MNIKSQSNIFNLLFLNKWEIMHVFNNFLFKGTREHGLQWTLCISCYLLNYIYLYCTYLLHTLFCLYRLIIPVFCPLALHSHQIWRLFNIANYLNDSCVNHVTTKLSQWSGVYIFGGLFLVYIVHIVLTDLYCCYPLLLL